MGIENSGVAKARIVIAVDLDYFYAQCEELRHPEFRQRPLLVCIYSGRTEDSGAVSTCNYVARALGVKSGIPIFAAKRLLREVKDAVFLPMDKEYYQAVSERVMEVLRSHADAFEQVSVDEAFLEVTKSCGESYEKANALGVQLKEEILVREGLSCSVGIAQNKLLSKMAADSRKPNALVAIPPEKVASFLKELPLKKLQGIGPKTEEKLKSLRITTVAELATADRELLASAFGEKQGPHLRDIANGIDTDPVKEKETAEQLSRIITLKSDALSYEELKAEIPALAADLSAKLRRAQLRCRTIGIIIITSELKTKNRARTLEGSTDAETAIASEASRLFQEYFSEEPSAKVRRIGIRLSGLERSRVEGSHEEKKMEEEGGPHLPSLLTDYF